LLSGVLPEAWGKNVQDYRLAAFGLLLVLMMIFRPEGLIGEKRRRIEEALPAAGAGGEGAAPGPSTGDRGP
ncbi:MAG: hypothetical protein MUC63_03490, partial [Planctomycetes bacterium]|nr:hypothetical protein [Planctomycetota bacterium]